jgi:hypothetical protein
MIAELADGTIIDFPDGISEQEMDARVRAFVKALDTASFAQQLGDIQRSIEHVGDRIVSATTMPRETVIIKDMMDRPLKSVTNVMGEVSDES